MRHLRVRDFAKIHHHDPSGFWNLVRTGEKLPQAGDTILFVYDIRGTEAELRRNLFRKISEGDPYKIANDAAAKGKRTDPLIAEFFKLPVDEYKPSTHVGVVEKVEFDEILQQWLIFIDNRHASVWTSYYDCECIVYWAPFPEPPNTYTERGDDQDLHYLRGMMMRERRVQDYLERRRLRNIK